MLDIKKSHPKCFLVAYKGATGFQYHKQKVMYDGKFIRDLIKANDIRALDFMETFYTILKQERTCEKDIMSRNYCESLEEIENTQNKKEFFENQD